MPKSNDKNEPYNLKRLHRSETDKILAGVAGGLAEYLVIDSSLIRLFFILLTIFGGSGVPIYLVLWLILPTESHDASVEEHIKHNATEMKQTAQNFAAHVQKQSYGHDSRFWLGILILVLGVILLLNNLGLYYIDFGKLWPLFIIIIGIAILFRRK